MWLLKWKSLTCVQLFATPWTLQSMEFSRPKYWRIQAFPFSRGSSQPGDWTQVSCIAGGFFTSWAIREAQECGVGNLSVLQQVFLTPGIILFLENGSFLSTTSEKWRPPVNNHYVGSRSSSSSPAFMPVASTHILTVTTGETLSKNHQSRPLPDPQKLWEITNVCFCKPLMVKVTCYTEIDIRTPE